MRATFRRISLYVLCLVVAGVLLAALPLLYGKHEPGYQHSEKSTLQSRLAKSGPTFGTASSEKGDLELVPFDTIVFERGPCSGTCPMYRMVLHKDGNATLVRDHLSTNSPSKFTGDVGSFHFARLAQLVSLARRSAEKDSYFGEWTDDYIVKISATAGGDSWTVSDYGQVAPPEVWALEELLHATYQNTEWELRGAGI
jgi:hypothetical protein